MLEIEIEKLPSFVMGEKKGEIEGIKKGVEIGLEQGIEIGIQQQKEKAKNDFLEVAKHLLNMNFPIDKIIEITKLSKSDLENLKKED